MARIHKLVKAYGAITVSSANQTLEKQSIKPLGDIVSWQLYVNYTVVDGTGTYLASSGTPAAHLGSNVLDLFRRIQIKDNSNSDIIDCSREELYLMSYLLSSVENDEFIFNKGGVRQPTVDSADPTAAEYVFNVPQRIAAKDLPATLDIQIGTIDDYMDSAGDATVTINQLEVWARYVPSDPASFTERVKSFQVASVIGANTDIAFQLPESIEILRLALTADDISSVGAPTNDDLTRIDEIGFKRGSADEIDDVRTEILADFQDGIIPNLKRTGNMAAYAAPTSTQGAPLGLIMIPTLAFVKTTATELQLNVNGNVQPVIYYVYK